MDDFVQFTTGSNSFQFEILTGLWNMKACYLVDTYQHFERACYIFRVVTVSLATTELNGTTSKMAVALSYLFLQHYIQAIPAANKALYWTGTWSYFHISYVATAYTWLLTLIQHGGQEGKHLFPYNHGEVLIPRVNLSAQASAYMTVSTCLAFGPRCRPKKLCFVTTVCSLSLQSSIRQQLLHPPLAVQETTFLH